MNEIKETARRTAQHGVTMPSSASPPSCCAGLRQTLVQGWQQDFPLHASPFRLMAARSGATPRELMATCRELQRSGALQPIRARWGVSLRRERWRLAFNAPASFKAALSALPGCARIEQAEHGEPSLWAEFEVLDETALRNQLDRLPLILAARLRMPEPAPTATLCCDDVQLAACVEQGLQISANPFADCARRLGRSERRIRADLSAWRRSGQLECLAMKPPPTSVPQVGMLSLWQHVETSTALLLRLRELISIDRVVEGPGTPDWPWRLSIVQRANPQPGIQTWREQLVKAGLQREPDVCVPLRIEQPRHQAMLFNTDGGLRERMD
ncbi:hypothetical protein [Roseateles aquatilis]|nr:hypothetical protein [Roseateles aquatilis]MBY0368249.1 hypothetical protein [Burkholderiaceae bacterium]